MLEPARTEIGQLAEFDFDWEETTAGRQVRKLKLIFTAKPGPKALAAAEENDRHSIGRAVRRDGNVERIAAPSPPLRWPDNDDLYQGSGRNGLYRAAVEHGKNHAVTRLAAAYVKHMGERRFALEGERLLSSWVGFVAGKAQTWAPA